LSQFWQNLPSETPISRSEQYASFNAALETTVPGASGLLFYPLDGTPRSQGAGGGYSGLRLSHTRADMGRAVQECAAYELRWALENIEQTGMTVGDLWMVGGATRSAIWPQILADVTKTSISLTQYSHGPALGAAILAFRTLGFIDGYPLWVSAQKIKPISDHVPVYDERYSAYLRLTTGDLL
jgi:sugar (pentulose or hexulose) kinase